MSRPILIVAVILTIIVIIGALGLVWMRVSPVGQRFRLWSARRRGSTAVARVEYSIEERRVMKQTKARLKELEDDDG